MKRLLRRSLAASAAALLLATGTQLATAPLHTAAAAPVTCVGTAKVYLTKTDGTLWLYEHRAPATGDVSWVGGRQIGAGFAGPTAAGPDGTVYWVNRLGELRRYKYDGTRWVEGGTLIGTGWTDFYDYRYGMTVDTKGRLLLTERSHVLRMFDSTVARWDFANGLPVDDGWSRSAVAAGDNVYYERDGALLYRWRYDPASQRFMRSDQAVGAGFSIDDDLFSPGGDVLYRKLPNGDLYWYRYDADTGTWANNGVGKLVGNGWNGWSVTAGANACTVPAPAGVGDVAPRPRNPQDAWQGTGAGANFGFLFLGDAGGDGRLMQLNTSGPPTAFGEHWFAATPSAAAGERKTVVGLDATGKAWISQGKPELGQFQPFGRGFTHVAVTNGWESGLGALALAEDAAGKLWWRSEYPVPGPAGAQAWTAWRRVMRDAEFQGFSTFGTTTPTPGRLVYGTASAPGSQDDDYWFLLRDQYQYSTGKIPAAADVDHPSVFAGLYNYPTLVARMKSDGQAYLLRGTHDGFTGEQSWVPLPPLSADGSVTVDSAISVDEVYGALVVALRGSDGHVYVTNQAGVNGDEFHPWQQLPQAANAPGVSDEAGVRAHLGFTGVDGTYYHYVTQDAAARSAGPLVFTGGAVR